MSQVAHAALEDFEADRRRRCAPGSQADALFAIALGLHHIAVAIETSARLCVSEEDITDTLQAATARQPET